MRSFLFFAGGVATGLFIAKLYARRQVGDAISQALNKAGVGGGALEQSLKDVLVPLIT